jgi:hypothetical protein
MLNGKILVRLLATLACLLLLGQSLPAQTVVTGEIAGTVIDPSSASVTTATVTLVSDATGQTQSTTTNAAGEFHFSLLRPGMYTIKIVAAGFEQTIHKASVSLGQVSTVKIQLGIQAQTSVVTVSEQAPLTQTEDANLATTFDSNQLVNLPAPGNDMTAYAFTAPGVNVSTGAGYGNFSAFGLPGTSNLYTVNGNDNMDPYLNLNNSGASNLTLGANELQEAAVVVNGYTGQYGRQAGAQVNYITKSGGNDFHGNASFYYNEKVLNANDFFNNATDTARPFAISREWAGSIGGRIIKNKLFFYYDNEGLRYVLPGGGPVYIPTPDFSAYVLNNLKQTNAPAVGLYTNALNLYGTSSGASRAVPVTAAVDPALGCGDFAGGGFGTTKPCAAQFQSSVNNLNTERLQAIRGDYNVTDRDRIYLRYNDDHGVQATGTDPINPAFNANSVQPQYGGQAGYTKVIGSRMVNQLLLSATYYSAIFGPPDFANAIKTFPTTWTFADGLYSNMGGTDNNYPQGRKVRQWQLVDDFSYTTGAHELKVGMNMRKNWVSTYAAARGTTGLYTFYSMTDFVNGSLDAGGSAFSANFPRIGAQGVDMYSLGFYLQDEWKVRKNLKVTLALRMDRNSNINCGGNCFNELLSPFAGVSHNVSTPYNQTINTGLSQALPGLESIVPEPRIGVAYSINPKTVLRGGFGIFTDLYPGTVADRFITNSPNVISLTTYSGLVATNNSQSAAAQVANSAAAFQNGFANGATLAQLKAAVPGFTVPNYNTVVNNFKNPKYYEWNVEVQRAIAKDYALSVNYVGNHGFDEFSQTAYANGYTKAGYTLPGLPSAVPDARFGNIRELNNNGWSNYAGLVTSFKWRLTSSFSGQFNYTWSHALDTISNGGIMQFNLLSAPSVIAQVNPSSLRALNYSSSDYDSRHIVSANYVYNTPNHFTNRALKAVVGGWTVAGTVLFHSSYPYSIVTTGVRSSQTSNLTGLLSQIFTADWLGGNGLPSCSTPNMSCFAKSQFATATTQHDFGNLPRNSFRGPGYFDTDLNINKTIPIFSERYKLNVGAYMFNILNHPNFDLPVNSLTAGNFGRIESTVSAPTSAYGSFMGSAVSGRVVQLFVKFSF